MKEIWRIQDELAALEKTLLAHAAELYGHDGINKAWCEFTDWCEERYAPGEKEAQLFHAWYIYQWAPYADFLELLGRDHRQRKTVAESYLEANKGRLKPLELDLLKRASRARPSFFEVREIGRAFEIGLHDLLLDESLQVIDQWKSQSFRPGDIVFSMIVRAPFGTSHFLGCCRLNCPEHKRDIIELRDWCRQRRPLTIDTLMNYRGEIMAVYYDSRLRSRLF